MHSSEPHLIIQGELRYLVSDVQLPKNMAKLFRLIYANGIYLQLADVKISQLCRRQQFNEFLVMEGDQVAYNNVNELMEMVNLKAAW